MSHKKGGPKCLPFLSSVKNRGKQVHVAQSYAGLGAELNAGVVGVGEW
jgi:hypothetical protein